MTHYHRLEMVEPHWEQIGETLILKSALSVWQCNCGKVGLQADFQTTQSRYWTEPTRRPRHKR